MKFGISQCIGRSGDTANPSIHRSCAKSRAVRLTLRWEAMIPNHILLRGLWFAAGRMVLFLALFAVQSTDAQWQLVYLPLWVLDFPVSLGYFYLRLPIPWVEAIVGPIWWFILPLLAWLVLGRRRLHRLVAAAPAGTAGLLKGWAVHP